MLANTTGSGMGMTSRFSLGSLLTKFGNQVSHMTENELQGCLDYVLSKVPNYPSNISNEVANTLDYLRSVAKMMKFKSFAAIWSYFSQKEVQAKRVIKITGGIRNKAFVEHNKHISPAVKRWKTPSKSKFGALQKNESEMYVVEATMDRMIFVKSARNKNRPLKRAKHLL